MNKTRFFRALIGGLAGLALVAAGFANAPSASAQWVLPQPNNFYPAGDAITAVSTDVGLYIKYVGAKQTASTGTATVAVDAATGDIAFVVNGGADTSIGCPTATGTIDTSDAACDTFTEVVAVINKTTNWRAEYGAVLGSDSTNNTLITRSAAVASGPDGVALLKDTVVALNITLDLTPNTQPGFGRGIRWFMDPTPSTNFGKLNPNPYAGLRTIVPYAEETIASSGTVGQFAIIGVTRNHSGQGTAAYTASEVKRTILSSLGGATTVQKIFNFVDFPIYGGVGERIYVRISSGTDLTAPAVGANAVMTKVNN